MEHESNCDTIVIDALYSVTKGLLQDLDIRGLEENNWTKALLKSEKMLRKVFETEGTCYHYDSSGKICYRWFENLSKK